MFWWHNEVVPGVSVAFTDTGAGNLALHVGDDPRAVAERRDHLDRTAGLGGRSFQYMNQVHGNAVEFIASYGPGPTVDAMVSAATHGQGAPQPLAVMVADCVPIVFVGADTDGQPITGVAHAGRPGVASRIVPATVAALRGRGALDIKAWLGPSICGSCYEVPEQLRDDVAAVVPAARSTTSWGTASLDLPAGVRSQLAELEVPVLYSGECTLENKDLFSYRRDPRTGRFAGLVWTHE
ncbi:polyphenol oxidase family protein [Paenarthrobacter ilicis]|uniref:polyphenol oxidase family protein n=1 Tax=Paenarthrobacter ilicis TaxID=43665 RepID=UPI0028D79017|nr:polyphenol oxidase family protein [Paenarthrobacter ilicis]